MEREEPIIYSLREKLIACGAGAWGDHVIRMLSNIKYNIASPSYFNYWQTVGTYLLYIFNVPMFCIWNFNKNEPNFINVLRKEYNTVTSPLCNMIEKARRECLKENKIVRINLASFSHLVQIKKMYQQVAEEVKRKSEVEDRLHYLNSIELDILNPLLLDIEELIIWPLIINEDHQFALEFYIGSNNLNVVFKEWQVAHKILRGKYKTMNWTEEKIDREIIQDGILLFLKNLFLPFSRYRHIPKYEFLDHKKMFFDEYGKQINCQEARDAYVGDNFFGYLNDKFQDLINKLKHFINNLEPKRLAFAIGEVGEKRIYQSYFLTYEQIMSFNRQGKRIDDVIKIMIEPWMVAEKEEEISQGPISYVSHTLCPQFIISSDEELNDIRLLTFSSEIFKLETELFGPFNYIFEIPLAIGRIGPLPMPISMATLIYFSLEPVDLDAVSWLLYLSHSYREAIEESFEKQQNYLENLEKLQSLQKEKENIELDSTEMAIKIWKSYQEKYPIIKERVLTESPLLITSLVRILVRLEGIDKKEDSEAFWVYGESGVGKSNVLSGILKTILGEENVGWVDLTQESDESLKTKLFGSVRWAYTGAEDIKGYFEIYKVVVIDEIAEIKMQTQKQLLSAIKGKFTRVGEAKDRNCVTKVIIALTSKRLNELVKKNEFDYMLYNRLGSNPIEIPPLRKRPEDALLYWKRKTNELGYSTEDAGLKLLEKFQYPGNYHNLDSIIGYCIEQCRLYNTKIISKRFIEEYIRSVPPLNSVFGNESDNKLIKFVLEEYEKICKDKEYITDFHAWKTSLSQKYSNQNIWAAVISVFYFNGKNIEEISSLVKTSRSNLLHRLSDCGYKNAAHYFKQVKKKHSNIEDYIKMILQLKNIPRLD